MSHPLQGTRTCLCLLWLATLLCACAISGCGRGAAQRGGARDYDSVVKQAVLMSYAGNRSAALSLLDAGYAAQTEWSKSSLVNKYKAKSGIYATGAQPDYGYAQLYIDSALQLMQAEPQLYKQDYLYALFTKGDCLMRENDLANAFRFYYEGSGYAKSHLGDCDYAWAATHLGSVLYHQQRYTEAIRYIADAYNKLPACGPGDFSNFFGERQGCLDNIGLCYERLGNIDSALAYYNKALCFISSNENQYPGHIKDIQIARAVIIGNAGSANLKKGNMAEAERLFKENIAINSHKDYANEDAHITEVKLATLYLREGRLREALAGIEKERHLLDAMPANDPELTWLKDERELAWRKLAWSYYDTIGDKAKAYYYSRLYNDYSDTFNARKNAIKSVDINRTFDHLSQQSQIAALQSEYAYTKVSLAIAVLFAIMALVIGYLVWRNYKISKGNLLKLTKMHRQMSGQNMTMQKTLNALQQSQQDNSRIIKTVAHDLANPIAAMVSLTDLLDDTTDPDEKAELCEMLRTSGMNAIELIKGMLRAAPELKPELHDLHEVLMQCVGLMRFRANEKRQRIVLHTERVTLMADREKLWRVINNLIVNAIKFSHEGKTITVSLTRKEDKAIISVQDDGIGISEGLQGEIFNHFSLAGKTGTAGEPSYGLGLSIVKQLVEAHGGRIWFQSKLGVGSTFFVELPVGEE